MADRAIPPLTAQHVASFEASEEEGSLAARLERIADQAPDKLAVQDGERLLTFAELDQTANRIAHCILQRGCESDRMVAFLLEHGEPQIVALWGILKAGKGFLALSTDLPAARHAYMLDDAEARLIVTNNRNLARARALAQDTRLIINLDQLPADLPVERPGIAIPPDRIAWISYTSGSTGTPKGAVHTQRSLLHCAWSAGACLPVYRDDRCAYIVPISYAAACIPLFVASLYQASVHCYDLMQEDFGRFAEWLRAQAISVLFTVPSVFRRWASTLQEGAQLPALRLLLLGGERLYGHDAQLVGRLLPDSRLTNLYGTSESLVTSSHRVDTSRAYPGRVPVGYMHPGYEVRVLDDAGQPVPLGETGEIVVKSQYLSSGYWHMPAQTTAAFRPDPEGGPDTWYHTGDLGCLAADGCLEHLGRKDAMVKVRGQRVELGEVESRLLQLDGVKEAAVVARDDAHQTTYLTAYVEPTPGSQPTPAELRTALGTLLPSYMVPSHFMLLSAMPHNSSGKVDRTALPDPGARSAPLAGAGLAPSDEMERRLVAVCESVLEVRPIGILDDLLDLGATSLDLLALSTELERALGRPVPTALLLKHTRLTQLAAALRDEQVTAATASRPARAGTHLPVAGQAPGRRSGALVSPRRALRRAYRRACYELATHGPAIGPCVLPYKAGAHMLAWLCARPVLRRLLGRRSQTIERCLVAIRARRPVAASQVLYLNCLANFWRRWRGAALARLSPQAFDQWVQLEGREHLPMDQRGIVFAGGHLALMPVAPLVLQRAGFRDASIVGNLRRARRVIAWHDDTITPADSRTDDLTMFANQLYEAKRTLERGGQVMIAADGYMGTSQSIVLPFLGRQRPFKTSFAELALATDAAVIPLTVSLVPPGRVRVRLGAALVPTGQSHGERVASLVRQYATALETHWSEDLGSVSWGHLSRFLELPLSDVRAGSSEGGR